MSRKEENGSFICVVCEKYVLPLQNGSYRNHCPFCLSSVHVDNKPGDRKNACAGVMIPCKLIYNSKKGWQVIHKCSLCATLKVNKIAETGIQPDSWDAIIRLS